MVVTFVSNFHCLEMNRPRRYTAQQAIRLIQQIDENDSGDSGDANSLTVTQLSRILITVIPG